MGLLSGTLLAPEDFTDPEAASDKGDLLRIDTVLGTWRLRILAQPDTYLSLCSFSIDYCTRVFVNGAEVRNIGFVSEDPAKTTPMVRYMTLPLYTGEDGVVGAGLMWDYDVSLIGIPIMLVSGAGGGDDWVVTGEQLDAIYDDIPGNQKVKMRRADTPHGEVLYSVDGYVTAWFMWQLQNDEEAALAFIGENPEIATNPLYQDQLISLSE